MDDEGLIVVASVRNNRRKIQRTLYFHPIVYTLKISIFPLCIFFSGNFIFFISALSVLTLVLIWEVGGLLSIYDSIRKSVSDRGTLDKPAANWLFSIAETGLLIGMLWFFCSPYTFGITLLMIPWLQQGFFVVAFSLYGAKYLYDSVKTKTDDKIMRFGKFISYFLIIIVLSCATLAAAKLIFASIVINALLFLGSMLLGAISIYIYSIKIYRFASRLIMKPGEIRLANYPQMSKYVNALSSVDLDCSIYRHFQEMTDDFISDVLQISVDDTNELLGKPDEIREQQAADTSGLL